MQELLVFFIVAVAVTALVRGVRSSFRGESKCGGCASGCAVRRQGEPGCPSETASEPAIWSERGIPSGGLSV